MAYKFGWIPDQERKYEYPDTFAFEQTSGPGRLVIAPSANTLIEYGNCMTSRSLVLRKRLCPAPVEERQLREEFHSFARAIRAGVKEYGSIKKLR